MNLSPSACPLTLSVPHHGLLLAEIEDAVHDGVDAGVEAGEDEQALLHLLVQQRRGRPVEAEPERARRRTLKGRWTLGWGGKG